MIVALRFDPTLPFPLVFQAAFDSREAFDKIPIPLPTGHQYVLLDFSEDKLLNTENATITGNVERILTVVPEPAPLPPKPKKIKRLKTADA